MPRVYNAPGGLRIERAPEGSRYKFRLRRHVSSETGGYYADTVKDLRRQGGDGPDHPFAYLIESLIAGDFLFEVVSSRQVRIVGCREDIEGIGGRTVEWRRTFPDAYAMTITIVPPASKPHQRYRMEFHRRLRHWRERRRTALWDALYRADLCRQDIRDRESDHQYAAEAEEEDAWMLGNPH